MTTEPQEWFAGDETLVPGALRVYRCWSVEFDDDGSPVCLKSTGIDFEWDAKHVVATCYGGGQYHERGSPAPLGACKCGVYGWYHPDDTRIVVRPVFGLIQVTGKVVLGKNGVRAERAELVAMSPYNRTTNDYTSLLLVRALHDLVAARYPGVRVFSDRRALAREYGIENMSAFGIAVAPVPVEEDVEPVMPLVVSIHGISGWSAAVSGGVIAGTTRHPRGLWNIRRIPLAPYTRFDQLLTFGWLVSLVGALTLLAHDLRQHRWLDAVIMLATVFIVTGHLRQQHWSQRRRWFSMLRLLVRVALLVGVAGLCLGVALTVFAASH